MSSFSRRDFSHLTDANTGLIKQQLNKQELMIVGAVERQTKTFLVSSVCFC